MDVEGVIGADEGDDVFEMGVATALFDGRRKGFGGAALAVEGVGFLTPEGGS